MLTVAIPMDVGVMLLEVVESEVIAVLGWQIRYPSRQEVAWRV